MKEKKPESESRGILEWILGPDLELLTNRKTRIGMIGLLISVIILIVTYDFLKQSFPLSLVPAGFAILAGISWAMIQKASDEFFRDIFKTASSYTLMISLVMLVLTKPFQETYPEWINLDAFLVFSFVQFCFWMLILHRLRQ